MTKFSFTEDTLRLIGMIIVLTLIYAFCFIMIGGVNKDIDRITRQNAEYRNPDEATFIVQHIIDSDDKEISILKDTNTNTQYIMISDEHGTTLTPRSK